MVYDSKGGNPDRDYSKLLRHGRIAQCEKLLKYSYKESFEGKSLSYILERLNDELKEFKKELYYFGFIPKLKKDIDYKKARKELADIANFCHMGILTCDEEIKKST